MRDFCANNNMDIASLMKGASQLVELRALGIIAFHENFTEKIKSE